MKNCKGYTLLEFMIAGGIIMVIVLAGVGSLSQAYKNLSQQYFYAGVDRVALALTAAAGNTAALRASIVTTASGGSTTQDPVNQVLFNCVDACPTCGCTGVTPANINSPSSYQDFRLYGPYYLVSGASISISGAITGTPAQPVQYSPDGSICDPTVTACPAAQFPIQVSSQFRAFCPPVWDGVFDFQQRDFWPAPYQTGISVLWDPGNPPLSCGPSCYAPYTWGWGPAQSGPPPPSGYTPTGGMNYSGLPFPGPSPLPVGGMYPPNNYNSPVYATWNSMGPPVSYAEFPASSVFPWAVAQTDTCFFASEIEVKLSFSCLPVSTGVYSGLSCTPFTTTAFSPAVPMRGGAGNYF